MSKTVPKVHLKINVSLIRANTFEGKVLQFINENGKLILDAFFPKNYPAYTALGRWIFGLDVKPGEIYEKEKQKIISAALRRLQNKGLIAKIIKGKKREWILTQNGENFLDQLQNSKIDLPLEDGRLRVFVFDIPETRRQLRDEIRMNLIKFGYKMLQKSVWIGKRPLPLEFLKDIKDKGLFLNIHLFEVKEGGTTDDLEL